MTIWFSDFILKNWEIFLNSNLSHPKNILGTHKKQRKNETTRGSFTADVYSKFDVLSFINFAKLKAHNVLL